MFAIFDLMLDRLAKLSLHRKKFEFMRFDAVYVTLIVSKRCTRRLGHNLWAISPVTTIHLKDSCLFKNFDSLDAVENIHF